MIVISRFRNVVLAVLLVLLTSSVSMAQVGVLSLPPRPAGAMTGSQFYAHVNGMTDAQREQAIVDEVATGNVPDFLRTLVPVTISATVGGSPHTVTYYVTPDYVSIGTDSDYFRMPMSGPLAQQIVDIMGCHLPTRKMVNDIWSASATKLSPQPFSPSTYVIDSVPVFWLSNEAIDGQLSPQAPGPLVAGHKKDVVVTPQLLSRPAPARVAIYGWHYTNGTPIQPLSLIHVYYYEDYSHGIRGVQESVLLDSQPTTVSAILANPSLTGLLNDEAPFSNVYPIPSPYPLPSPPAGLDAENIHE